MFRPFWSFDIRETEDWLQKMALKGYQFVKLDVVTRIFYFKETDDIKEIQYHLDYGKDKHDTLPMGLVKSGWLPAYQSARWNVIYNENTVADILCFPVRDGVIKRNRRMMYIFTGMTMYILLTTLLFLILSGFTLFFAGGTLTFNGNVFWISTFLVGFIIWLLAPFGVVKLYQTNKQFW
ncbi:DUF2812 domain-containing protein [Virgibacillus oceani]